MKDPFPVYAELRAEQPVMFDERIGLCVVSRYDDIRAVVEDWETFSGRSGKACRGTLVHQHPRERLAGLRIRRGGRQCLCGPGGQLDPTADRGASR